MSQHVGLAVFPGTQARVVPVEEVERLRAIIEDLLDRQHDYPTELSRNAPEWSAAFDRARRAIAD